MAASNDQPDVSHGTDSAINPSDANQANDPVLEALLDLVAETLTQGDPSQKAEKAFALKALGPNPTWEEMFEYAASDPYGQIIFFEEFAFAVEGVFGLAIEDYLYLGFPQTWTHTLGQLADAIRSDLKEQDTIE